MLGFEKTFSKKNFRYFFFEKYFLKKKNSKNIFFEIFSTFYEVFIEIFFSNKMAKNGEKIGVAPSVPR